MYAWLCWLEFCLLMFDFLSLPPMSSILGPVVCAKHAEAVKHTDSLSQGGEAWCFSKSRSLWCCSRQGLPGMLCQHFQTIFPLLLPTPLIPLPPQTHCTDTEVFQNSILICTCNPKHTAHVSCCTFWLGLMFHSVFFFFKPSWQLTEVISRICDWLLNTVILDCTSGVCQTL